MLPFAGGLRVIRVPGHATGQVAFLLESAGVQFAGGAAVNFMRPGLPPIFEESATGPESLCKLVVLGFDIACFGHGGPIVGGGAGALRRRRGAE